MPRRNRPARSRHRGPRPSPKPPTLTTDQLARGLVRSGKASPLIVAYHLFRLEPRGNEGQGVTKSLRHSASETLALFSPLPETPETNAIERKR